MTRDLKKCRHNDRCERRAAAYPALAIAHRELPTPSAEEDRRPAWLPSGVLLRQALRRYPLPEPAALAENYCVFSKLRCIFSTSWSMLKLDGL